MYVAEAALRDKLGAARRQAAEAEGALLARDTVIQELRYDLEAALQVGSLTIG